MTIKKINLNDSIASIRKNNIKFILLSSVGLLIFALSFFGLILLIYASKNNEKFLKVVGIVLAITSLIIYTIFVVFIHKKYNNNAKIYSEHLIETIKTIFGENYYVTVERQEEHSTVGMYSVWKAKRTIYENNAQTFRVDIEENGRKLTFYSYYDNMTKLLHEFNEFQKKVLYADENGYEYDIYRPLESLNLHRILRMTNKNKIEKLLTKYIEDLYKLKDISGF